MDAEERLIAAFGADPDALLERALDDWLGATVPMQAGKPGEQDQPAPAPDEDRADLILGRMRRIDAERDRIDAIATGRIEAVRAWQIDMTAGLDAERERAETSLELFIRAWKRENPKGRKSIPLPNGIIALRAPSAGRVDVTDPIAFKAWAHENPDAEGVKWVPEPDKTALRSTEERRAQPDETIDGELHHVWGILAITPTEEGEVMKAQVPGVRYVQRVHEKFSAKTADELKKDTEREEHAQ